MLAWWKAQPSDLQTPSHMGNCVGCFLKGRSIRDCASARAPEVWERWAQITSARGRARFIFGEPEGYAGSFAACEPCPCCHSTTRPRTHRPPAIAPSAARRPYAPAPADARRGQPRPADAAAYGRSPWRTTPAPGTGDDGARILNHEALWDEEAEEVRHKAASDKVVCIRHTSDLFAHPTGGRDAARGGTHEGVALVCTAVAMRRLDVFDAGAEHAHALEARRKRPSPDNRADHSTIPMRAVASAKAMALCANLRTARSRRD